MNNTGQSSTPTRANPQDSLSILRDVSHIYEIAKRARRDAAKDAHANGATFKDLSEAMGVNRSSAFGLVNRDAA
jgi:hypothetical protein